MANYDGSITLRTNVDSSGIKQDAKKIANQYEAATQAVERQVKKVEELKKRLSGLESGEITVNDKGVAKLQTEFDKTTGSIEKTKAEISSLYQQLDQLQSNAFRAPDTGEIVLTGKEQAQFDSINAELDRLEAKLVTDKQKSAELGEALRNATGTATQSEIEGTKQKLAEAETKLDGLKIKADEAGQKLKSNMGNSGTALSQVSDGFGKMGTKLFQLAKGALVFSVITKGFTMLRQTVGSALMSNDSFRRSLYQLQAAFWTAFAPIYSYILPALKTLVNWITSVVVAIGNFIAALTGKSYSSMVAQGKALQSQADAYKKSAKGAGESAKATDKETKALEKQLAAFDELNILKEDKAENAPDVDSDGGGGGLAGAFQDLSEAFNAEKITNNLQAIMEAVSMSLVAVGLILIFLGNIGLGIGFIVAGAFLFSVSESAYENMEYGSTIDSDLAKIMTVASGMCAAIGLILIFLGNIPWGLGFIIVGAAILGVKEEGVKPYDGRDIQTHLLSILNTASYYILCIGLLIMLIPGKFLIGLGMVVAGIALLKYTEAQLGSQEAHNQIDQFFKDHENLILGVGIALLIIGILLCACSQFLIGMSIIFVGAGLIWTVATLNNQDAKTTIDNFFADNQKVFVAVGLALIVIGILICCISGGAALALGLGIVFAGAILVYEAEQPDWEQIKNKVTSVFEGIGNWIKTWGLLVLGIMLVASGAGIPLGLALIKKGGENLTEAQDPAWNAIVDKVKEVWNMIKEFWNEHIAPWFTKEKWEKLVEKIGNGLKSGFKSAINGVIGIVERGINFIIGKLNTLSFEIPDIVPGIGGKTFGISLDTVSIPRLARGAVLPPNKPFLAMLGDQKSGTNIEAPLSTIKEAVRDVLSEGEYAGGNQTIILELDGREVGRTFGKVIRQENNRVGSSLIKTKLVFG